MPLRDVLFCVLLAWTQVRSQHGPGPRPPLPQPKGPDCPLHVSSDKRFRDSTTNTCYYFYNVQESHIGAVKRCQDEYTRVIELGSKGEQDFVITEICKTGACTPTVPPAVWLGLFRSPSGIWKWFYKGNTWPVISPRWIDSSITSSTVYTTAVTDRNGKWRAVTGSETAMVVCEALRPEDQITSTPIPEPTSPSTSPPTSPKTSPSTSPAPPPTSPSTSPPTSPPASPSTSPPTSPPTSPSTSPPKTTSKRKTVPEACPNVGPKRDEIAISEYERLSTSARVLELSASIKGSRIACAKRCSQKRRCAMFKKASGGVCYLYEVSDSGVSSTCTGDPPTCYWKTCWIPYLDVI